MASKLRELPKIVVEFYGDEEISSKAGRPPFVDPHQKLSTAVELDARGQGKEPEYNLLPTVSKAENHICAIAAKLENESQINKSVRAQGISPLHEAAFEGKLTCVKKLIKDGACVNNVDSDAWTPLHAAVLGGHLRCVSFLVRKGANLWAETAEKQLAFNIAVEIEDDKMIALLAQEMTNQSMADI